MDFIQHSQPGSAPFAADPGLVERRTMRRAACAMEVTVRQRGRFAVAGATADLTPNGARLSGAGPFEPDSEMWLRLPGLESQTVRVIWSHGPTTGVALDHPLHTAVFARFLPADSRLVLVGEPATARSAEQRRDERFADALCTGPMRLTIGSFPTQVREVSASGLKVAATFEAEVGTRVEVEFEGFDPMAGQIVWRRADEISVSLPLDSLELYDA